MDARWLLVLGILLLTVGTFVTKHYTPALEDWQYMRNVSLRGYGIFGPVYLRFQLPQDANFWAHTTCRDLRLTLGSGGSEHVIPAYFSCDLNRRVGYAYVFMDDFRGRASLRLYYGNPEANSQDFDYIDPSMISRPRAVRLTFKAEVNREEGSKNLSGRRIGNNSTGSGVVDYGELPVGARVYLGFYGVDTSPGGYVVVPFGEFDGNNLAYTSDINSLPGTSIVFKSDGVGNWWVPLGNVTLNARRYFMTILTYPDRTVVYINGHRREFRVRTNRLRIYVVNSTGKPVPLFVLTRLYGYVIVRQVRATYSAELNAPKAPRVSVSPGDGAVVSSPVRLSVSVEDPNGDLLDCNVLLDGNVVHTGTSSFSADLNLPDGNHSLYVVAKDTDGAVVEQNIVFVVDTKPPVISLDVSGSSVDYSVVDDHLSGCTLNGDDVNCSGSVGDAGSYELCAYDLAGNYSCRSFSVSGFSSSGVGDLTVEGGSEESEGERSRGRLSEELSRLEGRVVRSDHGPLSAEYTGYVVAAGGVLVVVAAISLLVLG